MHQFNQTSTKAHKSALAMLGKAMSKAGSMKVWFSSSTCSTASGISDEAEGSGDEVHLVTDEVPQVRPRRPRLYRLAQRAMRRCLGCLNRCFPAELLLTPEDGNVPATHGSGRRIFPRFSVRPALAAGAGAMGGLLARPLVLGTLALAMEEFGGVGQMQTEVPPQLFQWVMTWPQPPQAARATAAARPRGRAMAFGRAALLERATELCEAFAQRKSLEEVLCHFSEDVLCLEHGLPELAPFLGRPFRGHAGARRYFELLAELLGFTDMAFSDYVVDVEACQVSVRGKAKFTWLSTGKSWDEVFMYRLKMDDANLISAYEVWADSGAAYLARTAPRLRVLLVSYEPLDPRGDRLCA
ncbi:unnamed protein product, partial [Effrenium voratum]